MARRRAARAEIAWRRHERLAEMVHPDTIDKDPARQRIVGRSDRPGQIEPATAVRERLPLLACKDAQELARHRFAGDGRVASHENLRFDEIGGILEHHRPRRSAWHLEGDLVELCTHAAVGVLFAA